MFLILLLLVARKITLFQVNLYVISGKGLHYVRSIVTLLSFMHSLYVAAVDNAENSGKDRYLIISSLLNYLAPFFESVNNRSTH